MNHLRLHVPADDEDEAKELYNQICDDPQVIVVDRVFVTKGQSVSSQADYPLPTGP